ncbi:TIGR01777 family protein [Chitinimonas arctica]|uniref:TIGR01777 family protein n=1 Tax=Chitinimonas arctica TaxID=2594795 RepID=A0A516SEE2_9NEIS|nr:TIGR01777 family oxidoreductase [Chitinimonas arctica]QDQ26521.1 TIGR01777 family protein [Chitinimonas arctica]
MLTTPLDWVLNLLLLQGLMGAFDTLYHHELTEGLPRRIGARTELSIHAVRAMLYGLVFAGMAWFEFHGYWTLAIAALVLVEIGLTLWDFVQEDASRKLPATERVLHTVLAINGGALFGLYAWQLVDWFALTSTLQVAPHGWKTAVLSLMAAGVAASGLRDGWAAYQLGRLREQLGGAANPFAALPHQRILVTGGTGFIGEALLGQLLAAGHAVTLLARDPLKAAYQFQARVGCVNTLEQLHAGERFDAIINLAGAPVVGPRWSPARKAKLLASRLGCTEGLLAWLKRAEHKPSVWIQASAIGFYGVRPPAEALDEDSSPGEGFMSELCRRWEDCAQAATGHGLRLVTLRLGLVFGHGGALPSLLRPFRLGLGGRMGNGLQMMSWIHLDDVLALVAAGLGNGQMQGVYNAVAPESVSQAEFARMAARLLHRPNWMPVPAAPVRLLLGEMAQLFFDGQQVRPKRLLAAGFNYRHPTLRSALLDLI